MTELNAKVGVHENANVFTLTILHCHISTHYIYNLGCYLQKEVQIEIYRFFSMHNSGTVSFVTFNMSKWNVFPYFNRLLPINTVILTINTVTLTQFSNNNYIFYSTYGIVFVLLFLFSQILGNSDVPKCFFFYFFTYLFHVSFAVEESASS